MSAIPRKIRERLAGREAYGGEWYLSATTISVARRHMVLRDAVEAEVTWLCTDAVARQHGWKEYGQGRRR